MDKIIRDILLKAKRVAVLGLSPKEDRPSYRVAEYLMAHGYEIIPVNPNCAEALGRKCYKSLSDVHGEVDVVDIFRRPEEVLAVVKEAAKIKAKAVWMQEGIINEDAAKIAKEAGMDVVMDRCMLKEHMTMEAENGRRGETERF
ncbi:MAG TPA: CoA-binding protein [Thermodesulfobacteriota bacterium]|nr:CoA-binding protein [Thermodesulfobacteriota bacterium]